MEEQIGIGFSWLCLFFSPKISENREETQKNKKTSNNFKKNKHDYRESAVVHRAKRFSRRYSHVFFRSQTLNQTVVAVQANPSGFVSCKFHSRE